MPVVLFPDLEVVSTNKNDGSTKQIEASTRQVEGTTKQKNITSEQKNNSTEQIANFEIIRREEYDLHRLKK